MKKIQFHMVGQSIVENSVFSYSDYIKQGPCDMCWGDLSM